MQTAADITAASFCDLCQVPVTANASQHMNGRKHQTQQLILLHLAQQQRCPLCDVFITSMKAALAHIQGRRHQKTLLATPSHRSLQAQISQQRPQPQAQPPIRRPSAPQPQQQPPQVEDPVLRGILQTGRCSVCSTQVAAANITQHVAGAKHKLRVKLTAQLKSTDWASQLTRLQQPQNGISIALVFRNVVVPLDESITFEAGTSCEFEIRLWNQSNKEITVKSVVGIPSLVLQQLGASLRLERLQLPAGRVLPLRYTLHGSVSHVGVHRCLIAFNVSKFVLLRAIDLRVVPKGSLGEIEEMAADAAQRPFVAPKRKVALFTRPSDLDIIFGQPPASVSNASAMYTRALGYFDLPRVMPSQDMVALILGQPLTPARYRDRFQLLLWLEERQMLTDIQMYDRKGTLLRNGTLYRLAVPGLAENRPSVQRGDQILACSVPFDTIPRRGTPNRPKVFSGFVHVVEREHVLLKFHADFDQQYINGMSMNLRFTFNRIPLRRCHQGLIDLTKVNAQFRLLPGASSASVAPAPTSAAANFSSRFLTQYTQTELADMCDDWIDKHVFAQGVTAVGLDTESQMILFKPNRLALIQISTRTEALVFCLVSDVPLPTHLKKLLASSSIVKYSVGPERKIAEVYGIELSNCIDVQQVAMEQLGIKQLPGTQRLSDEYVPWLKFVKDKEMQQHGPWGTWPLPPKYLEYAARDAHVALAIGEAQAELEKQRVATSSNAGQPFSFGRALKSLWGVSAAAIAALSAPPTLASSLASSSAFSSASASALSATASRSLNAQQRSAVDSIVAGKYHPYPFILHGPPGTGKTTVLVEAIQALYRLQSTKAAPIRILAVAPSNSAADLLIERLHNLPPSDIFRLNAVQRSVNGTPGLVRTYSLITGSGPTEAFGLKSREELLKYRVVVSTAISGSCVAGVGCQPGDFTHIIIDEAGHATEPELLATLGGLIDANKTAIILGGDPEQLGPIIRSPQAVGGGLAISLLERLISSSKNDTTSPYNRTASGYNPAFMVKLIHSYRSHPAILALPNRLFYSNELIASAEKFMRESLCAWPGWPNGNTDFPMMVHHVEGKESREAQSPSWFNLDECALVVSYVEALLEYKRAGLTLADIGLITPYSRQAEKLREMANKRKWGPELKIGSVEVFQGQERRVIILSTVRSQLLNIESFDTKFNLGFVNQPKRLNVAVTRAKQGLIIVGNAKVLETDHNWRAILDYVQVHRAIVGGYKPVVGRISSSPAVGDDDNAALSSLLDTVQASAARRDAEMRAIEDARQLGADDDDGYLVVNDQEWRNDQ